jgi:dTDP-4-dehydrorhamnose reductase
MPSRALVLGGTGMIGNAISRVFVERGIPLMATTRNVSAIAPEARAGFVEFDVIGGDLEALLSPFGEGDYVVNATGVIKQQIDDTNAAQRRNAIAMNSDFPYAVAALAERQGFRVIHVATDCVYSGSTGGYAEDALHDATDVYGHSKSLGEVPSDQVLNIRCSMIGFELKNKKSLLEWVLNHEPGDVFSGYTDHLWNGITARAFGQVVAGIVENGTTLSGQQHLLPADSVNKSELSTMILSAFDRDGIVVEPKDTGKPVDRTLATRTPAASAALWANAGYDVPPTIGELVGQLARSGRLPQDGALT